MLFLTSVFPVTHFIIDLPENPLATLVDWIEGRFPGWSDSHAPYCGIAYNALD